MSIPNGGPCKRKKTAMNKDEADTLIVRAYLDRIGVDAATAAALAAGERAPSADDLGFLLRRHLTAVPFENLSQHAHPAAAAAPGCPPVEAILATDLPTLDVRRTLRKIVSDRRGGFCWEINTAFAWLLRRLGYRVRLGCSHVVTPAGPVPGHVCLYVDGLGGNATWHVDPGFGDAPRAPLPAVLGRVVTDDAIGDGYEFVETSSVPGLAASAARFPVVLTRRRRRGGAGGSPLVDLLGMDAPPPSPAEEEAGPPPEPAYLLNFDDDLDGDCAEFRAGLAHVLRADADNLFARKRLCVLLRDEGFDFVGTDYWKEVRHGREVRRQRLDSEGAYRKALLEVAGIKL